MAKSLSQQSWGGAYGSQQPAAPHTTGFAGPTAMKGQVQGAPAPAPVSQPYDPTFAAAQTTANRNVALGNNEATWQTQNTGYNTGYNADGTLNTANPYSEAQKLQDSYHRTVLATNNSGAASGQGYSGSLQSGQDVNDRNLAESDAALKGQAMQSYHTIGANQLQNYATNSLGVGDAGFTALQKTVYGG